MRQCYNSTTSIKMQARVKQKSTTIDKKRCDNKTWLFTRDTVTAYTCCSLGVGFDDRFID